MRKTPVALLASSALLIPTTALFAAPAQASHQSYRITDCWKTAAGETVRVRIRDEGDTGRVRVSHHRAKTVFKNRDVARVFVGVRRTGGGASLSPYGNDHSFRTQTFDGTQVLATFKLRSGKRIHMTCTMR